MLRNLVISFDPATHRVILFYNYISMCEIKPHMQFHYLIKKVTTFLCTPTQHKWSITQVIQSRHSTVKVDQIWPSLNHKCIDDSFFCQLTAHSTLCSVKLSVHREVNFMNHNFNKPSFSFANICCYTVSKNSEVTYVIVRDLAWGSLWF